MLRLGCLTYAGYGRALPAWKLADNDRIRIETESYDGEGTVLRVDQAGIKCVIHWAGEGNVSGCWAVDATRKVHVIRGVLLWLR